jgi:hypothetical protein
MPASVPWPPAQLPLVVTARAVQRVLTPNGLDRLIPVCPSLAAATAAPAPAAAACVTSEPGAPHAAQQSQPGRPTAQPAGMTTIFGRPGLDWTVLPRRQPARIIAGQAEGGHTDMFDIICCGCGDDPGLGYREVPPELQRIRGPHQLSAGVAVYERISGGTRTGSQDTRQIVRRAIAPPVTGQLTRLAGPGAPTAAWPAAPRHSGQGRCDMAKAPRRSRPPRRAASATTW